MCSSVRLVDLDTDNAQSTSRTTGFLAMEYNNNIRHAQSLYIRYPGTAVGIRGAYADEWYSSVAGVVVSDGTLKTRIRLYTSRENNVTTSYELQSAHLHAVRIFGPGGGAPSWTEVFSDAAPTTENLSFDFLHPLSASELALFRRGTACRVKSNRVNHPLNTYDLVLNVPVRAIGSENIIGYESAGGAAAVYLRESSIYVTSAQAGTGCYSLG